MSLRDYEIREVGSNESAALFAVHAAIIPADAGQQREWTQELEQRLEAGGRAWVVARGRRLAGYAAIDLLPGLPGVYEMNGGIIPAQRRKGLGGLLLRHVQCAAKEMGASQLSCRVESLQDDAAAFLLRRGYFLEHEECLMELTYLDELPPVPAGLSGDLVTYPRERAITEFCRVYDKSLNDIPWSQPYTEAEMAVTLVQAEDLLFLEMDGEPAGVIWREMLADGRGRLELLGIALEHQGRGHGRRLLLAALHSLHRQGADPIELGVWRRNTIAMNLYKSLGFLEVANWYYLACNLEGLKAE